MTGLFEEQLLADLHTMASRIGLVESEETRKYFATAMMEYAKGLLPKEPPAVESVKAKMEAEHAAASKHLTEHHRASPVSK